jgi:hypothetical protein
MKALFEQFPLLLPLLGIAVAASVIGLFWVAIVAIGQRVHRAEQSRPRVRPSGHDIGHGVVYDSSTASHECGPSADSGGDCDGGSGGD